MNLEEVALRSYPAYFLGSLLGSVGWPRKRGLFGRGSVAGAALGGAWTAMMQALMGLGAGRPLLACQLLPHILPRKDWKTESADDFFARFDPVTNTQDANASLPWA